MAERSDATGSATIRRASGADLKPYQWDRDFSPRCTLRLDEASGHLFVACSSRLEVLNAGRDGAVLSSIDTGDGVDDIDYAPATHLVYVGAARAGKLTIARVDASGHLALVDSIPTPAGSRNPAVASNGTVYLTHGSGGEIVVVAPPAH